MVAGYIGPPSGPRGHGIDRMLYGASTGAARKILRDAGKGAAKVGLGVGGAALAAGLIGAAIRRRRLRKARKQ